MKLLVLGGTGATGKLLVDQALARGHHVTALVRDPASLPAKHDRLVVKQGKATVAADVAGVMAGHDAVVSVLGPRQGKDPVVKETADAVVAAMQHHAVKRVIWLSAGGVGDSRPTINAASFVFGRIILPLFLRHPYANHALAEDKLRASGLDFTVVRPLQLMDKSTGRPVTATLPDKPVRGLKITRGEVAGFMLDELEKRAYVGQMPLLWT
jgi:putative NADH-flavin reductase